jgi:16S rRNA (guanine527-N7)-methyltransferase
VTLVESNGRKCAFLREAARAMGVPAVVAQGRIENVVDDYAGQVGVVTARALAPLPVLIGWTAKLLKSGAVGLFLKGKEFEAELTETAKSWTLALTIHNSLTDPAGRILRVTSADAR